MDKILNLDSVDLYNKLYGLETLNPLVSVIDLNKATSSVDLIRFNYGIYALYLKLEKACDIKYGRQTYDYQEGTITRRVYEENRILTFIRKYPVLLQSFA